MAEHKISITFTSNAKVTASDIQAMAAAARSAGKVFSDTGGSAKTSGSGFKAAGDGAKGAAGGMTSASSSAKQAGASVAGAGQAAAGASSTIRGAGTSVAGFSSSVSQAGSAAKNASGSFTLTGNSAAALTTGLTGSTAAAKGATQAYVSTGNVVRSAAGSFSLTSDSVNRLSGTLSSTTGATRAASTELAHVGTSATEAGRAAASGMNETATSARTAATSLKETGKNAADAGESTGRFGKLAKEASTQIASFVSAQGIIAGVQTAFKFAEEAILGFDDALTQSVSIMGVVAGGVKESLGETAKGVAVQYNQSLSDVAGGYYHLISAGYDVETSQKMIGQATAFSKAGMFDLEKATELAADAQTAMGLKSADASENQKQFARITDVLTQANIVAAGSVEQFASALTNKAAVAAKGMGVSLEETVGALAVFASQGVKGLKAGEGLSIALRELDQASAKNKGTWEQLAITVYDAHGSFRGLKPVVEDLEKALGKMSVEDRNAMLAQLGFTAEGGNFIKLLLGQSGALGTFTSQMEQAGGATEKVAKNQMTSLVEQLKHLKSEAEVAAVNGFEKLRLAVEFLGQEFGPSIGQGVDILQDLWAILGPVASLLAVAFGGAVVGGVKVLSVVLEGLLNAVQGNEFAIRLLATGALAFLAAQATVAAASLAALVSYEVAFKLLQAQEAALKFAIALRYMDAQTALTGLKSFGATLASLPALAAGVGAALFVMYQDFQNTDRAAQDMVHTLTGKINTSSLDSMEMAMLKLERKSGDLKGQLDTYPGMWQHLASSMGDMGIPFADVENSSSDLSAELAATNEEMDKLRPHAMDAAQAMIDMANEFNNGAGATRESGEAIYLALRNLAETNNLDLSRPVQEWTGKLREAYETAYKMQPAAAAVAGAMVTMGDEASTAKEKVDAFKNALDNILGINVSVNEAQNKVATGLRDVAKAAIESKDAGISGAQAFDLNSEAAKRNLDAVVKNRESINNQVTAVKDMAEAYRDQGRSAADAAADMMTQRDQLVQNAQNFGLTKAQAEQYLAVLGLTPENIRTIAHAETGQATANMSELDRLFNQAVVPRTAVIAMNGDQASTAADVVGKLLDDTARDRTAVVDANADGATQVGQFLDGYLNTVTGKERTALLQADARAANGTGSELDNFLSMVMRLRISELRSDGSQAVAEGHHSKIELDEAMRSRQAILTADGSQAINEAGRVRTAMQQANDAALNVAMSSRSRDAARYGMVDGGIVYLEYARGGMLAAEAYANGESHVAQIAPAGAWRVWAEPETGGESYIPLAGEKRTQSTKILEKTADLFGYQLVPKGTIPYASGGLGRTVRTPRANWSGSGSSTTVVNHVSVSVNADSRVSRSEVLAAVNAGMGEFSRNLRTEIRGRRV